MVDVQPVLTNHPFFADMPRDHIDAIAGCASERTFVPGEFPLYEVERDLG